MRKPTILRTLIFVLAMLFNFASYSQNLIAYNSKFAKNLNENIFLKANNQLENPFSLDTKEDNTANNLAVPIIPNPVIKYAQAPYAGVVSECPNDGKLLPKLFLCGLNDSRLIETGITDASVITWQRRTGGCATMANGNCANEGENCTWADVASGPNYAANSAGEFRVIIRYVDKTVFTFYFNVYKNEVDPTGIIKTDIVKDGTGCTIPGQIIAGGFGNGYEYSFTTNPAANVWQDSNTFPVTAAGTYNVFIRLKNVTGSCIFNVKGIVVSTLNFASTVTITQPACNGEKGSVIVRPNTLNNQYIYKIFKNSNLTNPIATGGPKSISEHEFTGLDDGDYTIVTTIEGTCATDTQAVTIKSAKKLLNNSSLTTGLSACNNGLITGGVADGTAPYIYYVNFNNGGFVLAPNGKVIVQNSGTYVIRVQDLNGCTADKTITVGPVSKPIYTVTPTSGKCDEKGKIVINVTDTNGYAIQYSINGAGYTNTGTFNNLAPGAYDITIKYTKSGKDCFDILPTINIGATTALTASAGIAALSGCGPVGKESQGIARITNPQGGTPYPAPNLYRYSFDNKVSWQTSNEGYLDTGGPYTVYIQDAAGCEFAMGGLKIDPKPAAPNIQIQDPVYNCDGTATSTVTVNGGSGDPKFSYKYYIDGKENDNIANPNIFLNVPQGDHIITVDYQVLAVSSYSNLLDESFGSGENTTSPGINTFYYCFERQIEDNKQSATWCNGSPAINDGDYSVTSFINQNATSGWNWRYPVDHTKAGADLKGRFLAVNIGDKIPVTTILYEKQINDVIPNQPINFEFYAMNLMMPGAGKADANLRIALVDDSGTEISWFATGSIARSNSNSDWKKFPQTPITLNPGAHTSLRLIIRSNVRDENGNDVAIDDIKVFQVPRACGTSVSFPFKINTNKIFTARVDDVKGVKCNGETNGEFNIYAENFVNNFQYSINNAAWQTSAVSPVKISNLAASATPYSVRIRYNAVAVGCDFDIPTLITSPAKFQVKVTTVPATCAKDAVVEVEAIGGVGPYNFVLTKKPGGTTQNFIYDALKDRYVLTNVVPGVYTVTGTDGNSCATSLGTDLTVGGSTAPTATVDPTSNFCFNPDTGASIKVNITGGKGPFSYKVSRDGGLTYSDLSATFTATSFTYPAPTTGTYDFIIVDANSCQATAISQTINPQFAATPSIKAALSCKPGAGASATILVTIDGGTSPFDYIIRNSLGIQVGAGNTATQSFEYTTTISDTYTFDITDKNKCPIKITQKISDKIPVTAEVKAINATCFGTKNGYVDLKGLTGLAPFTFEFNGTGGFTDKTHYEGLEGSVTGIDYTFIVKDANECTKSYTFKIFQPADISGKADITTPYTCDTPATITVSNVAGGTAAYNYTLYKEGVKVAGPQAGLVFNTSIPGDYTVTITDANSCTKTIAVGIISALNPPKEMTITDSGAQCPTNTANVTIKDVKNAAGVLITGTLEYRISAPTATAFQPGNVFNDLDANVAYKFEVRDANKCTYEKPYTILLPTSFAVASKSTPVKCFNGTDGTATFTVTGIATGVNYTYKVDALAQVSGTSTGSPFDIVINSLTAGSHSIVVTNSTTNCPVTENVIVGGPTAALALNPPVLTHVTCKDLGTAEIKAINGTGTYTYTVTPTSPAGPAKVQANNNKFINLGAGTYSVSVTDLGGCTVAGQTFTINDLVKPLATIDVTSTYCAGGAGATLIATPSVAPKPNPNYEYSLNGGDYQDSGTFSGLAPADYTITVRDKVTGCTNTVNALPITIALPLTATPKVISDLTCDPTSPEAKIEVTINNGYPDYKYRVNTTGAPFGGVYTNVGTGATKFTLARLAGTYYIEITDSKGCIVVIFQKIDATVKPDFTTDKLDVKCKGASTGSITVNGIPATGTYTYVLNTVPATTAVTQTTNIFNGLGAGTYSIVVIDAKKCQSDAKEVIINEPVNGLTATAKADIKLTCDPLNASQPATIVVTASGGTPYPGLNPYRYSYNGQPAVTSNTYSINTAGTVTVEVFDASNCSYTVPAGVVIDALKPPKALVFSQAPIISCKPTELTTDLKVTVTDGVPPFKFEITSTDAATAPANPVVTGITTQDHTYLGLSSGNYYFKITDVNNCTIIGDYYIAPVVPIQAIGAIVTNVTCNGLSNGVIKFTVSGNTAVGYTFGLVSSASATNIAGTQAGDVITYTGLKGGLTYTFTVTNTTTGCKATDAVILADPAAITITSKAGTKVFCTKPKTDITITAAGGTGTLNYAVVKQGVTPVAGDYNTTGLFQKDTDVDGVDYDVYITDSKGCPLKSTLTVPRDAAPTINPITTPVCYAGANFTVKIVGTVYGGTPLYGLNGSYDTNDTKTITGPGTYTLGIMDDHGCEKTTTITVNSIVTLKHVLDKDLTCSAPAAAQITLTGGGGNATYAYDYKLETTGTYAPVGSDVFNPTVAGNYYFRVTSGGCSTEIGPIKVTDPETPTATAIKADPKCYSVSEGTITITPNGGVPGYQYRINGGAWQDTPVFTDLAAAVAPGTVYSYEVKDSKGCISVPKNITLIQPSKIVLDRTIVGITCVSTTGVSLGSITINSVTGGTGPYNYYVTGAHGYKKEFKNVPGTLAVFEIVDFGLYEIRITDANGCVFTEEVTITSPPDDLDITVNAPTPTDCSALGSAVVAVGVGTTIPIGNGPFFFSYYTGVKPVYPTVGTWYPESPAKQATITGLIPGVQYTFIVYDSHSGCYYYETAEIPIPSNSTLTVGAPTSQNVTCKGSGDGKVTFNVTSVYSTPTPITYEVYDALSLAPTGITGSGTIPANGTLPITDFGPMPYGDYFVLIKEAAGATNVGCSKATAFFSIRESAELLIANYTIVQNDNCKTDAGIIRVSGTNGTGPYKYMVTTTPGTPVATDPAWTTSPIFNRDSANYYAWVKDDFGCIKGTPVFLLPLDPNPAIALSIVNKCAVDGAFEISVDLTNATTAIAPFYISINNNTSYTQVGSFPYVIKNLTAGNYKIYVKDKNSCDVMESIDITPTPKLTVTTKQLDCSAATPNATIDVTITDGTGPFKYEVKKGTAAYSAPVTLGALDRSFSYPIVAADADTYILRITDANNCEILTNAIIIKPLVPIVPDYVAVMAKCFGNNGTIQLSATGGKGPYKFNFNNLGFSDETNYSVIAGTYSFIVKDALECEVTGTATLGSPDELKLNAAAVTQLSCGPGNAPQPAKVVLSATGGTGAYEYSFDGRDFNGENTYYVTDSGASQTILYSVRDVNGCTDVTGSVVIDKFDPPTGFDMAQTATITCATLTTTVNISNVKNSAGIINTADLTYQIVAPLASIVDNGPSASFAGLLPGDYVFQVTYKNGCTKQLSYTIKDVTKINIAKQSLTDITCFNANDGKGSFLVTGFGTGVGTYNYLLDTNPAVTGQTASVINLTGLIPGAHKITVQDDETKCSMFIDFNIDTPAALLVIDKTVTPRGCTTFGAVTITADKGWGSYVFTLTEPDGTILPSSSLGVFGGLTKIGIYNISVKDAKGCEKTDTFELLTPINPVVTIDATSVYCYSAAGSTLVVNASSTSTFDVTPYQYSINDGETWQDDNKFTDLAPGDYKVTVRDKFGCTATALAETINAQLFASAKKDKEIFCAPAALLDGKIIVEAKGGYPPYSYTVTKDGLLDPTVISFPIATATAADYTVPSVGGAGSYVFTVTDSRSCSSTTVAIVMVNPTPVTFTATPTVPSCTNSQGEMGDGQISITGVTGNGPYKYTIQRTSLPAGSLITQDTPLFTGLIAGTYSVNVISDRGCDAPAPIVIGAPIPVVAKATHLGFVCTPANVIKETIVSVDGSGGAGTAGVILDYRYSDDGINWYEENTFKVYNTKSIQHLTFYVKDAKGCIASDNVDIIPFPTLESATPKLKTLADCKNGGKETITVDIVGGSTPYNFKYQVYKDGVIFGTEVIVPGNANSFDYIAPDAGHSYHFVVTDVTTGCTITTTAYQVKLYNLMKVNAVPSKMVSCKGFSDATITINIENYAGKYDYRVLLAGVPVAGITGTNLDAVTDNPLVITGLAFGDDYTVEVTQKDYPECTVLSNAVSITEPDKLDITGIDIAVVNQNCHNKGATITVDPTSISGGTGGYEYAFVPAGATPDPLADYSTVNSKTFVTGQIAPLFDSYDVYVRDLNKICFEFKTVHISLDPLPTIINVKVVDPCVTTGYRIEVTANGVPDLQYSLDGNNYQDDNFFIVDTPGDYKVWVWDKNQCQVTAPATVTVLKPLTVSAKIKYPTCENADGVITLFAEGGTVTPANSYVYTKDNWGTNQLNSDFGGLAPGTYTFKVRDIVTKCEKEIEVIIPKPTQILGMKATPRKVTCKGYSDGGISVSISDTNDNPEYTYSISGPGVNIVNQSSSEFNGLAYGNYIITVRSGRGCEEVSLPILVDQPDDIVVKVSNTEFACTIDTNNTINATITVDDVTGGSGDYVKYQFLRDGVEVQSGLLKTYTQKDHAQGNYVVKVYDTNSCEGSSTTPIKIPAFATLDDMSFTVKTPITCVNDETIQTNVVVTGTLTGLLEYTITGVAPTVITAVTNNTGEFSGLGVGDYLITVKNPATDCVISNYHHVFSANTFVLEVNTIQSEICYGTSDGSVIITMVDTQPLPSNEAGPFKYTVTGPIPSTPGPGVVPTISGITTGVTLPLTGLKAGKYTVTAKLENTPECDVVTGFEIIQPLAKLDIDVLHTAITCKAEATGYNDGTITVTAQGGWPGAYRYELVGPGVHYDYSEVSYFENLAPGLYTVNVKDTEGCMDTDVVDLVIPDPITFTATPNAPVLLCYGDDSGSITVTNPLGGQGFNYSYTLSYTASTGDIITTGPQSDNVFNGLTAGTYTITVSDGFSCMSAATTVKIDNPAKIEVSLSQETGITCFTDATLTLTATGGTAPYTYYEDGSTVVIPFNGTTTFPVSVGTHRYFVKDNLGCLSIVSNTVGVDALVPLAIELDLRNATVNCKGDNTAIIVAKATGGLGNYQYSLVNGAGAEIRPAQPDGIFKDLSATAGPYTVHVKSGDCQENSTAVVVTEPQDPLKVDYDIVPVKCFGDNNGKIVVTASGGTGVIKYAISPNLDQFVESGTFDRLEAGTYTVIVQDLLGCNAVLVLDVLEPGILIASEIPNTMLPEICKGDKNAAFYVQIKGGVAPYFESLDNEKGPYLPVTGLIKDYLNQVGGKHNVYIKDSNGCISQVEIRMPEPVVLDPTFEINYDCVNNAQSNMVIVTVDKSNIDLTQVDYSLDSDVGPWLPSNIFTDVAPGTHYIVARHTNGCKVPTTSFSIKAYEPLTLALSAGQQEMNVISVTASGGAPAYEYSFNGEPFTSSNKYKIYKSGDYKVIVRDQNGCTYEITVPAIYIDVCLDNYFTPNGDGIYDTWGPGCTNIYNNLEFSIFDRYGRVIAKYHYGQKWDGRYNGAELPSGDYWYVLKLNDEKDAREFVGHFTLYR